MPPIHPIALLAAAGLLLSACTNTRHDSETAHHEWPGPAVELVATPFHPQSRYQCGPASLATVLNASGVAADPDELVDEVYLPVRQGSLAVEMQAATRARERLAYPLEPIPRAIAAEITAGRPVLVLLDLGTAWSPVWHYAVVIGYQADDDQVILRSGTERRQLMPLRRFNASWARGGHWAMVVLQPGELPAEPDYGRYLGAVMDLEAGGHWTAAEPAYRSAVTRWPDDTLARFGLANALLATGRPSEAADAYRQVITRDPHHRPAWNNLAETLLQLGDCPGARTAIEHALAIDSRGDDVTAGLQRTRDTIRERCH